MRAGLVVVLVAVLAASLPTVLSTAPPKSRETTFAAWVGSAHVDGSVGKTAQRCSGGLHSVSLSPGPRDPQRAVIASQGADCRVTVTVYEPRPDRWTRCGYAVCGVGDPSTAEIQASWIIVAGPATFG